MIFNDHVQQYCPEDSCIGLRFNPDVKDTDEFYSFNQQIKILTVNGKILQFLGNVFRIYYETKIHNNYLLNYING